jgi:release factor glutamine methyltransferase
MRISNALVARLRAAGCVFAEDEARLLIEAATGPAELTRLAERRAAGEPLEQVLGWAEFDGLRITVEPGVFVPRRRSELVVARAAELTRPGDVVLDLCCGSGALAAALRTRVGALQLYAADLEPAAVRCARRNLPGVPVLLGDLFDPLPATLRGRVRVLLANTPYVPSAAIAAMPPEARDHEPRTALDGGADGLDVQRRVATEAPGWLAPGGHLLFEIGADQETAARAVLAAAGFRTDVVTSAELGATVIIGTAPDQPPAGRPDESSDTP